MSLAVYLLVTVLAANMIGIYGLQQEADTESIMILTVMQILWPITFLPSVAALYKKAI